MSDAHDGGNAGGGPETITLWVVVPVAAHGAAEGFAKCFAEEGLEELLAAFVLDLAALRAGRRGFELSWALGWLVCRLPRGNAAEKEGA